jgi:hypothetical protein
MTGLGRVPSDARSGPKAGLLLFGDVRLIMSNESRGAEFTTYAPRPLPSPPLEKFRPMAALWKLSGLTLLATSGPSWLHLNLPITSFWGQRKASQTPKNNRLVILVLDHKPCT